MPRLHPLLIVASLVEGEDHNLVQFHFHSPSEHQFEGQHVPMEMHLVHKRGNDLAVVALFIIQGTEDQPWFAAARADGLPESPGECSEGVDWFLMGQYLELSVDQIAQFMALYSGNNRHVQALGDRDVIYDGDYGP